MKKYNVNKRGRSDPYPLNLGSYAVDESGFYRESGDTCRIIPATESAHEIASLKGMTFNPNRPLGLPQSLNGSNLQFERLKPLERTAQTWTLNGSKFKYPDLVVLTVTGRGDKDVKTCIGIRDFIMSNE